MLLVDNFSKCMNTSKHFHGVQSEIGLLSKIYMQVKVVNIYIIMRMRGDIGCTSPCGFGEIYVFISTLRDLFFKEEQHSSRILLKRPIFRALIYYVS